MDGVKRVAFLLLVLLAVAGCGGDEPAKPSAGGQSVGVTVTVWGPHGQVLPFAPLVIESLNGSEEVSHAWTNECGQVHLKDVSHDGTQCVRMALTWPDRVASKPYAREDDKVVRCAIRSSAATLRAKRGVIVELAPYDATSEEKVSGVHWSLYQGLEDRLPLVPASQRISWPVRPGDRRLLRVSIAAPPGYLCADRAFADRPEPDFPQVWWVEVPVAISRSAKRLRLSYPLRREALIDVSRPLGSARAKKLVCLGHELDGIYRGLGKLVVSERGEMSVRGVPFYAGASLTVVLADAARLTPNWKLEDVVGMHPQGIAAVIVKLPVDAVAYPPGTLPQEPQSSIKLTPRFTTDAAGPVRLMGAWPLDLQPSSGFGHRPPWDPRVRLAPVYGVIRLAVLDRHGEPAPRARLEVNGRETRADPQGRLVLRLRPGVTKIVLADPDYARGHVTCSVSGGATQDVVLAEPEPCALRVRVTNLAGTPLEGASVRLERPDRPVDLEIGVGDLEPPPPRFDASDPGTQLLEYFTDRKGERTLRSLGPGRVIVGVTWQSRFGRGHLDLKPGGLNEITVVARSMAER